jgi:hypothetical protein
MLVRTCRMGNLPIRLHVRNWWMVYRSGKEEALMQFTTADAINKLGLD